MARKVIQAIGGEARGKRVALLGLAFKPNTDDMRDAPSIAIMQGLLDAGAKVAASTPSHGAGADGPDGRRVRGRSLRLRRGR